MATERCAAWAQAGPGDGVGPSALCPALHCARAQVTCTELGDPGGRCALWPSRARSLSLAPPRATGHGGDPVSCCVFSGDAVASSTAFAETQQVT